MKTLSFDIWAHPAVKRVGAWAIVLDGQMVGRIILAYPNDGAGMVKCLVSIHSGPLKQETVMRGQAGGYGYDKASAAVADAFQRHGINTERDLSGRGMPTVVDWFSARGYSLFEVV